jgi:O-antigen ligase
MNVPLHSYNLKARHIYYAAIGLLGASFLSFFSQTAQVGGFVFFAFLCLILGLWRREFALYLALLELTLGSFGYLLSIPASGLNLSLRYAFFMVIMGLFIADVIKSKIKYQISKIILALAAFFLIWLAGIVNGYFREYNLSNIFFDANSYLYLLLFFPAISWIDTEEKIKNAVKVMLSGALILSLFTAALFIFFTRIQNPAALQTVYKWVRDFRIGEITPFENGAYRIFIQSQIYSAVMLLFMFVLDAYRRMNFKKIVSFIIVLSSAIYIGMSRSIWIGLIAGFLILLGLLYYTRFSLKKVAKIALFSSLMFYSAVLIVSLLMPKDAAFLAGRLWVGADALDTRMSQLKPFLPAIKDNLFFGSGFGKTLTFKSFDPRIGGADYTTYAFEWGYLDMILKFGVMGLVAYLCFVYFIIRGIWQRLKVSPILAVWSLSAIVLVCVAHIFTPYLNHPLGIGILIVAGAVVGIDKKWYS